ncbi:MULTISPECIES: branched-chain amino acid ABC transporter permease [unclassified Beijerinckia]|uniref:branched-chain amino acid ABC transporter permease n=1 Tax=unclassified Beijerinckia TaxID=2638183 RepID=UPI00089AE604|nr:MULTISPECIES: branched-chain amino acid ABC transporter permease [unclassified Beijerinckia]MDH7796506.1 branched-chain amino acid transport system permease protein [Beijerinckia sp. GAS462]SEC48023.1 amino acid/amide ABC transporter membrane protein 1, HAAT family [Beijerinckia sp. 28-YEA-48]
MLTILFDGIAYGMLLFVLSVGLCVTLGLMNFINLAHGAFAMAGGYLTVVMMNWYGISFYWCLPAAFIASAVLGVVLERTLYSRLYDKTHLDQVLFSIGLIFIATAAVDYVMGASQQIINLPAHLSGRFEFLGASIGVYRLFVIVICGLLTILLQYVIGRTRFGSRLRASVDDRRVARGLGIDVTSIFALTFAVGSGLAGLGGALGASILSMDPTFPLKYMIYFLIVISVGGTTTITGPFFASILLGIADVAGKYFVPSIGGFIIYSIMVLVLIFKPEGLFTRSTRR